VAVRLALALALGPLIEHAGPLPDGQVGAQTVFDKLSEDGADFIEIAAAVRMAVMCCSFTAPIPQAGDVARLRVAFRAQLAT
jgi:hypothetical protein